MELNKIYFIINELIDSYIKEGIKPEHLLTFLNVEEDNYKFMYNRLYRKLTLENIQFDSKVLNECLTDSIRDKVALFNDINNVNESILVPRNLDGREDKLKQRNYKLLQQEEINADILIDKNWIFDNPIIKCKKINGNVSISYNLSYIPEWLENIEINGDFKCADKKLKSLKGCPHIINGSFVCFDNDLTTLEYGPEFVGGYYLVSGNKLISLKGIPEKINGTLEIHYNNLTSLEYFPKEIKGNLYMHKNNLNVTGEDIRKICLIKGEVNL